MGELPADIRDALARSRAQDEPSAEDRARVASALALRLGMPDADWANPPPSAAKATVAHTTWTAATKLLAGAAAIGLATTLLLTLLALPAPRKTGESARATPLTAAKPEPMVEAPRADVVNSTGVEREPDASEPRRRTTRASRSAHDTRLGAYDSASPSPAASRAPARGHATLDVHATSAGDDLAQANRASRAPARDRATLDVHETSAGDDLAQANTASRAPARGHATLDAPRRNAGDGLAAAPAASARAPAAPASRAPAASDDGSSRSAAPAVPPPSAAEASSHASLARELVLVRGASRALDRDEAQAALQLLNQHAREFADGALAGERETLRLSALCRLGRTDEARALRAKLAAELAHSPLRARIEHDCARD